MGASHRRHGTGGGMRSKAGVLWRPPDGAKRRRVALAEFGRGPKGCECDGVGTRRVETPRGKRVKRAATHRWDIDLDGEIDWGEDTNYNGILDDGEDVNDNDVLDREYWTETDANNSDTDDDGLDDGVERGVVKSNAKIDDDTDQNKVRYDADPRTTTDPLHMDTDGDGLPDGFIDGWGFNEKTRCWGEWAPDNGVKDIGIEIDVNGHTIVLAEYEDKDTNGAVAGDNNSDDVYNKWETWTETSANNGDADDDGATDGMESVGWYVTIYYERNPKNVVKTYKTYSDPLDGDTDDDGLNDGREMVLGGDPNKEDTDGDSIGDDSEGDFNSSLNGKEASPPSLIGKVHVWKDYDLPDWNHWDTKIIIRVTFTVEDSLGLNTIDVKVKGKGKSKTNKDPLEAYGKTNHVFVEYFNFSLFNINSITSAFWSGWDVSINVTDRNGNWATETAHVNSIIENLRDEVKEGLKKIYEAGYDVLKSMVLASYNSAMDAMMNGGKNAFDRIVSMGADMFEGGDDEDDFLDSVESVLDGIYNPVNNLLNPFTDFVSYAMDKLDPILDLDYVWDFVSGLITKGIDKIKELFMPVGYEDVEVDEEEQNEMMSDIQNLTDSQDSINGYIMEQLRGPSEPIYETSVDRENTADVSLDHLYYSPDADDYAVLFCTQENWNDPEQFEDVLVPRGYRIVKLKGEMATSMNLEATLEKLIYMCDENDNVMINIASHGSKGSFILNDGEIRSYGWLDSLLDKLGCKVTIVIDSCYSGSARPFLAQEGREVYTSVGEDELSTGEYDRRFAEALGGGEADVDGDGVVEMWEADRWGRGIIWDICMFKPVRGDFDQDGFDDILERNTSFWESLGVPDNELPNWRIPDIYIEVDWMKSHKPMLSDSEHEARWFRENRWWLIGAPIVLGFLIFVLLTAAGGPFAFITWFPALLIGIAVAVRLFVLALILWQIYIDSVSPFGIVEDAFNKEGITLHIDTGWGTGYGGDVIDEIKTIHAHSAIGPNNDFYDLKWGNGWSYDEVLNITIGDNNHFNPNRLGFFHYCIFGNAYYDGRYLFSEPESTGYTPRGGPEKNTADGDDFFIAETNVRKNSLEDNKGLAGSFMHELGHNLGLVPYRFYPTEGSYPGIDNILTDYDNSPSYEKYRNYRSCMNYRYQVRIVDYSHGDNGDINTGTDFDDWDHIDLSRVATAWSIYEGQYY